MSSLAVLGLFASEAELRDHVAANLAGLEAGLTLTSVEYKLANPNGSGGQIDVLARDPSDHVVVIEIKRSDKSARATLNELAKYISLLINESRVRKEAIRCLVLSTDWHELRLPFSYFAATCGVHVEGRNVVRAGDDVAYEPVALIPIEDQPQLSPDVSIYHYPSVARRDEHVALIAARAPQLRAVRAALLKLDPAANTDHPFIAIGCVWRIRFGDHDVVENVIGAPIGHLEPYAFPGWEAETDTLFWLADDPYPADCFSTTEAMRGTPEKIANYLRGYACVGSERFGDWPATDLINTDAQILAQLSARSGLTSSPLANRYIFEQVVQRRFAPSWRSGVEAFRRFIAFEPIWADAARRHLERVVDQRAVVTLQATDHRNPFFLLHQARAHPEAEGSKFQFVVTIDDKRVGGLVGGWTWDGRTHPTDPESDMARAYGSLAWAVGSCYSAVDETRYEEALYDMGFRAYVLSFVVGDDGRAVTTWVAGQKGQDLQTFVSANRKYVEGVAHVFAAMPTGPPRFD